MGIAFDENDNLIAMSFVGASAPPPLSRLYNIDIATGIATSIGLTGINGPHGADIATVPEPATILLLGFGLVGLVGVKRKLS